MERTSFQELNEWKHSQNRKPLILKGARQVGKTWLIKEFGKRAYQNTIYLNFESSENLQSLFKSDFDIKRILATIEIEIQDKIEAENTLIIFDEIQEAEKGLTALKYFYENAPEYHIIAAGSLLGVSLQKHAFPVGKVDFLNLYPLSFFEFLTAIGQDLLLIQLKSKNWAIINTFHDKLVELLRHYYFIGGMPEAVANYIENKDFVNVRTIQNRILIGYENDFAKYAPNQIVPKIKLVWNTVISQLAKENRKYTYGQIKKGARAKDFEEAITWLMEAGLTLKVPRIEQPKVPLKAYANLDSFKLFFVDVGLLNAMAKLDQKILLEKNNILIEFKGALTEQFVAQQLAPKTDLFYWSNSNSTAEIDFLIQKNTEIIPIEVKAEENLKAKSLKFFVEKFQSKNAVRLSMSQNRIQEWMTNIPLYAAELIYDRK